MALRKVVDFSIAQDGASGYLKYKLQNADGSSSDWIGWVTIPLPQLASLHQILDSHNAYYDDINKIFVTGAQHNTLANLTEYVSDFIPQKVRLFRRKKSK